VQTMQIIRNETSINQTSFKEMLSNKYVHARF